MLLAEIPFDAPQTHEDMARQEARYRQATEEQLRDWQQKARTRMDQERSNYQALDKERGWFRKLLGVGEPPPMGDTVMGRMIDNCLAVLMSVEKELERKGLPVEPPEKKDQ